MAHSIQGKKRIRQEKRRTLVNRNRVGRLRTHIKRVEAAIEKGDGATAAEELRLAQPQIMRGVIRGVLHKNTARRKISRLSKQINSLGA